MDTEDWAANDRALLAGARLLSSYALKQGDVLESDASQGVTVWIITEADHSATTLLLPEEY